MTVHNFNKSLSMSHGWSDAAWWRDVYKQAFPTMQAMVDVRPDGWAQRGGIDRQVFLGDGTVIKIDEKVRAKDWPDFCLEGWSDRDRKVPGWIAKPMTCDFIAYAFIPSRTCYLLPFQLLRLAWAKNGKQWWTECPHIEAVNRDGQRSWTTESVAVPIKLVLGSITACMVIRWSEEAA